MLQSGAFLPVLQAFGGVLNPLLAVALMLALTVIILYYALARLLSSPQLEAFAREEFSQFIFTMLILASFFMLYFVISNVASIAACGGSNCDHMDVAIYSLGLVRNALSYSYFSLYIYEFWIGLLSTMGFTAPLVVTPIFILSVSVSPFSGFEPVSNALITVIESMGYLFGLAYGREMLVYFFKDVTGMLLLPLGLLLRTMPFSRKTGSSIIAIAFAGYFAYPLSIILSHNMMLENLQFKGMDIVEPSSSPVLCQPQCDISDPACQSVVDDQNRAIGQEWASEINSLTNPSDSIWESLFGGIGAVLGGLYSFFEALVKAVFGRYNQSLFTPDFMVLVHFIYYFMISKVLSLVQFSVMVLITFVFEIVVTVTAFRSLSGVMGGEMEILGLTKVV